VSAARTVLSGKTEWQCKECGHTSCRLEPRGAPIEIIRLALTLTLEGVGLTPLHASSPPLAINARKNAVIGWVRKFGAKAHEISAATKPTVKYIQIDEMFSTAKKRQQTIFVVAIDGNTGRKIASRIGDRSAKTLRKLMAHIPWNEETISIRRLFRLPQSVACGATSADQTAYHDYRITQLAHSANISPASTAEPMLRKSD